MTDLAAAADFDFDDDGVGPCTCRYEPYPKPRWRRLLERALDIRGPQHRIVCAVCAQLDALSAVDQAEWDEDEQLHEALIAGELAAG